MIDRLNALFAALSPLWEMSLTAAYAAAIVAALRLILKKRAPKQVLCLLWLVVFARLLIPLSLESPVSIVPDALPRQEQHQAEPAIPSALIEGAGPVQNPAGAQAPGGITADPAAQSQPGSVPVITAPEGAAPQAPEAPKPFPWRAVLAGVWLAGALAMGGYGLLSYLRLRRRLFDAIRAGDGVWEHPSVASPFILGVVRPRIYLPAGLYGQPRQFILCHERAHLRRLDHIVKPVCWLALALHWFNPAVWLAFLLMSRDIEAACDEAVIRSLGPQVKADYSATLLSLATSGRIPAPCPLAFDEGDAKGRIQNVLRYRRPALWIVVVSAVMVVMAAVCLLTDPVSAQAPDNNPDPMPSASPSQPPEESGVLDPWMKEVLDGERTFRDVYGGAEYFNIHQLRTMVYGDEEPPRLTLEVGKLTVMDLDRDGVNEMVVWPVDTLGERDDPTEIGYTTGYFIFRRRADAVSVDYPGWRAFSDLKADGTFDWSSSAFNSGTGRARFDNTHFGHLEVEPITWCDNSSVDDGNYFVDGLKATREEFEAARAAQSAKPEPVWYTYSGGVLSRVLPAIPLDDDAQTAPVPDFLDEEQQLLYRRAYAMYGHIFGASTEEVDNWPGYVGYGGGAVERNGWGYIPATGLYRDWNDFQEAVLSVFTQEYWDARNNLGDGQPIYTNIDGQLHYVAAARGSGGGNPNFPNTFRLVEKTDDAISFVMTGYYSDSRPFYGSATDAEIAAWLAAGWEYSIEFPMRMVRTDRGWRFDEFHNAGTDNGVYPFYTDAAHIPNPDAPPPPTPTPEPAISPEAEVTQVGNGYQVSWGGRSFAVDPSVTPDLCADIYQADFDGDGRNEVAFALWASPVWMLDLLDNGSAVASVFDPAILRYDLAVNSVAAITPAGGMTFTYSWGALDESTRRYVSTSADFPDSFFQGINEALKSGKPLTVSTANGGVRAYTNVLYPYLDVSVTVALQVEEGGTTAAGRVVGFQHYAVRYDGGGFTVDVPGQLNIVSDSPQGSTPSQPARTPAAECAHGLDTVSGVIQGNRYTLVCKQDGYVYTVPSPVEAYRCEPLPGADYDGDGHIEHAFQMEDGRLVVCDFKDGRLVNRVFDPGALFAGFDRNRACEVVDDANAAVITCQGQTVRVPLDRGYVLTHHGPNPQILLTESGYHYAGYTFQEGSFDLAAPVDLSACGLDGTALYAHWNVRCTESGLQEVPGSFRLEAVSS